MDCGQQAQNDDPASGQAVFHERLFSKRLDQAFRIGAIWVVAMGAVGAAWLLTSYRTKAFDDGGPLFA